MHRFRSLLTAVSVVAGGLAGIVLSASPAGATVPTGFVDELVVGIGRPTALAFTPDGRILVTTQAGTLRVVQGAGLLPAPAVDLSAKICSNSERGLLGVAVDPAFATNGFVFLYYSFDKAGDCGAGTVNRVARFVMTGNALGGEAVLLDNIPSPAGNHNGGDLQFGKDGLLYVSVGDGGCDYQGGPLSCGGNNDATRDRNVLLGKILRIDRDGNIPAGNPFTGTGTARCNVTAAPVGQICRETFAWGLRNPFRFAFDPNVAGTRFHINDVGQAAWEEIDLGAAGADYGWNVREGHCATSSTTNCGPPPAGMTNPIFDYGRSDGCGSITGGAFVPTGVWPAEYQGRYLFADFGCGKIFRLDPAGAGGFSRVDFATGLGGNSAVHLRFGPVTGGQALYYTTLASGGQVRRIVHSASRMGELRVTTSPPLPSQVLLDGVPRDSFGLTWLKLAAGQYTLSFTHVEGWTEPAPQTVTVVAGAVTTATGSFTRQGMLRAVTSPAVPGTVSVDGVPRDNWGVYTDLPAGSHQVCFGPVAGFAPPPCQSVNLTAGAETLVTGTYTASAGAPGPANVGQLRVTTSPPVPSQILVDGVARDTWALAWLNLAPGNHTVSFTHVEGFTEPAPATVTVTAGATTTLAGAFTQRGSLEVKTNPPRPGTVSVDGVPRNDWGMWTDLPTGAHQVCFGPVSGFAPPVCQSANLSPGAKTTVTGTYS